MQVTVIGSSGDINYDLQTMSEELGRGIAKHGAILICGGRDGVMAAVCKGAKEENGLTVGILPGSGDEANRFVDVKIITGMGDGRNVINSKSADVVIVVGGRSGTLSEIGHALKSGKKIIALKNSGGVGEMFAGKHLDGHEIYSANSVDHALELTFE